MKKYGTLSLGVWEEDEELSNSDSLEEMIDAMNNDAVDEDLVIVEVVRVVRAARVVVEMPAFATRPAPRTRPAAAEPEYKVGDEVEVTGYVNDEKSDRENWRAAVVSELRPGSMITCRVTSGPDIGCSVLRTLSEIRRPAVGPVAQFSMGGSNDGVSTTWRPLAFGEKARCRYDSRSVDFLGKVGVVIVSKPGAYYVVAFEEYDETFKFAMNQASPL